MWTLPFSREDMMGGVPLRINPQTGLITATPDVIGQYLIGVRVDEYRNGEWVGYTKRDFEFNVQPCGDKPSASFTVTQTDPCDGYSYEFTNTSMGGNSYIWYFDHPNLTPSSNDFSPTYTYTVDGRKKVVLIVENAQGCTDSSIAFLEVGDVDTVNVEIMGTDSTCTGEVSLMAMSDSSNVFEWALDSNFTTIIETGDKLNANVNETTKFWVRAGGADQCKGVACWTVVYTG